MIKKGTEKMNDLLKQYVLFFMTLPTTFVSICEHSSGHELITVKSFSELIDELETFQNGRVFECPDVVDESNFLFHLKFVVGDRIAFITHDNFLSPLCSCSGGHTAAELLNLLK